MRNILLAWPICLDPRRGGGGLGVERMIHCWVKHRLERQQKGGGEEKPEDDDDRQLQRSVCHAALARRPGFFKLEAAQGNAGLSSCWSLRNDPKDALFDLDRRPPEEDPCPTEEIPEFCRSQASENVEGTEENNLETWSLSATQGSDFVSSSTGSRRSNLELQMASSTTKRDLELNSGLLSAIKNVVKNAVDSLGEDHHFHQRRGSSTDFVADDLLRELEKAAKQVADMEAEMKVLKERVRRSEDRGSQLEQTLSKVFEKHPILDDENCQARLQNAVGRLAFMEEICIKKDLTILELEREVTNLQSKIAQLLNMKGQQRVAPVTIKELLVKIGSSEAEDRTTQAANSCESMASTAATKRRPTSTKKNRRRSSIHCSSKTGGSSSGILMDMAPNLLLESRRLDYRIGSDGSKENFRHRV